MDVDRAVSLAVTMGYFNLAATFSGLFRGSSIKFKRAVEVWKDLFLESWGDLTR